MGGVGEHRLPAQARPNLVLAEHVEDRVGMGGRLDTGEIEFAELLDILEDASELGLEGCGFFVGEFDARQAGDISDIKVRAAHENPNI